ncbi:YqjK family protein [Niveibacterium sp. 24ML]|uniref:YqjK family protein n=1 Tax=Niveibacterium sp. 24ML TaxID=2985512 RepID=UPI00226F9A83|nr:YqjK family protein [Niveibacterium sp. 24ML]MCX9156002.1 YqjK family protein [Niveibacterium sp. 24ML]
MPSRRASVEQRRAALVARSREQRAQLVHDLEALAPAFRLADRFMEAAGWIRRNGLVIVGVAAVVIAVRKPSRLIGYAGRAWSIWQMYRSYRDRVEGLLARIERRA